MSSQRARRQPRVPVALDVVLQLPQGDVTFKTRNVSYDGVFIVSNNPLPLRKLIRFRTHLPGGDELQMIGLVAHTINAIDAQEQRRPPGMGIQLYSVGQETAQRWREFVREQYTKNPETRAVVEASERPHVRVRIPNRAMLERFYTTDLPAGGIFLRTPDLHPEGSEVVCEVIHPESARVFQITANVVRVIPAPVRDRGMQLAMHPPEDPEALRLFVYGAPTA